MSDYMKNPVARVQFVPIVKVEANNYNPNAVPKKEMYLLYISIKTDGYTQPVVTIYDAERDKYIIVDGFHRYTVMMRYKDIREANQGMLPIVTIKADLSGRMASTVRHNRARGKHSVQGMGTLVLNMLQEGETDGNIMEKLGMTREEVKRLKHITGYSKLFDDVDYSAARESEYQSKLRREHEKQ